MGRRQPVDEPVLQPTLDQLLARQAKFAGSLRTAGMPDRFYQLIIDDKEFREQLVSLTQDRLEWGLPETSSQRFAHHIMGKHFLGVPKVERHLGVTLSDEVIKGLALIPYSDQELRECAKTHVLWIDMGMSIVALEYHMWLREQELRKGTYEKLFVHERLREFRYHEKPYAKHGSATEPRWRLTRYIPVENSLNHPWEEQCQLVAPHEEIPSAREIFNLCTLLFLSTGERIFEDIGVRTSDLDVDTKQRVNVIGFTEGFGIELTRSEENVPRKDLGIVTTVKPDIS